jgi:hypothetical protein
VRRLPGFAAPIALVLAAVGYVLAAWAVPPGFFDGLAPPAPYRWVSPPPQLKQGNQPPLTGHGAANVGPTGQVEPGSIFTADNQAEISFIPGAFTTPANHSPVTIDITPVGTFPSPGSIHLVTNVYCFRSTSPIAPGRDALITLTYSDSVPGPSSIYGYQQSGPWQKIGSTGTSAPYTISARAHQLGCFAAGGTQSTSGGAGLGGGGQMLPVLVAILIVLVLLAGLPLVVLRRRQS